MEHIDSLTQSYSGLQSQTDSPPTSGSSSPPSVDLNALAAEFVTAHPPTSNGELRATGYLAAHTDAPEALTTTDGKAALRQALEGWMTEQLKARLRSQVEAHPIHPVNDRDLSTYLRNNAGSAHPSLWQHVGRLEGTYTELRAAASRASSSETEETEERRPPHHEDPTTWDVQELVILFDESSVSSASDWANYRDQISRAELRSEHGALRWNVPFHKHLQSGSWGISFIYRLEDRAAGTVTPVVYDFATRRQDNDYVWSRGGKSGGPSGAGTR